MAKHVVLSKKEGKTRLDILGEGEAVTMVFEPLQNGFLQGIYDENGGVLQQKLVVATQKEIDEIINSSLSGAAVNSSSDFKEIKLNRGCPKCGTLGLDRTGLDPGARDKISVMPLYLCGSCGCRGYYLTDHYLKSLVLERGGLFSDEERKQLMEDERAFMDEIKAYIIRIFASKKVECIK
jgi:hypothetical protein